MKETQVLFNSEMVKAILDGRKTQTRRVVKAPKKLLVNWGVSSIHDTYDVIQPDEFDYACFLFSGDQGYDVVKNPYGKVGDRLWVKETWRVGAWDEGGMIAVDYKADGFCREEWLTVEDNEYFEKLWKQSTDDSIKVFGHQDAYEWEPGNSPCRWRPSIFMPRWASRITLEITGVRVERLQDISEDDCCRETGAPLKWEGPGPEPYQRQMRMAFAYLWDSINVKSGYGWNVNPWVWAIEFKRL